MADQDVKLKPFARTPSSWDPQDDLLLRKLKEQQKLGWKEISSHFQNRTPNACQFRWRRLRSGSLKNSTVFSNEETKLQIQPKTIRRHSLLSNNSPFQRSSSFSDLQSNSSIDSNKRIRSYSTLSSSLINNEEFNSYLIPKSNYSYVLWQEDEDNLLLSRHERDLNFKELSILLPSKSEMDIWLRIEYLETNKKLPQLSRSISISSSISNQSLILQSRENSISNQSTNDDLNFTKKRSIKLPSLGSILNNF